MFLNYSLYRSKHIKDQICTANSDEMRRSKNVIEAIDSAIRASHIDIPQPIVQALNDVRHANADADSLHSSTAKTLSQFTERVPRFISELEKGVSVLGHKLYTIMETGNEALVDKQATESSQLMGTDFEDLRKNAILLMLKAIGDMTRESKLARELAKSAREDLLELLDGIYKLGDGGMNSEQMEQLLDIIKNQQGTMVLPQGADEKSDDEVIDEHASSTEDNKSIQDEAKTTSDDFNKLQKDQAEVAKTMLMESTLKLEEIRNQEKLDALKNRKGIDRVVEDNSNVANEQAAEIAELEKQLETEREAKLVSLINTMDDNDIDGLSIEEQQIISMASASYAVAMRICALNARREYANLQISFEKEIVNLNTTYKMSAIDSDVEVQLHAKILQIVDKYENQLNMVRDKLVKARDTTIQYQTKQRNEWLSAPNSVNYIMEKNKLQNIVETTFNKFENDMVVYSSQLIEISELRSSIHIEQTEMKINSLHDSEFIDHKWTQDMRSSAKNMANSSEKQRLKTIDEEKNIWLKEKTYLNIIVEFFDVWGIKIRDNERQNHLFTRCLYGVHDTYHAKARLSIMEHELVREAGEIQLIANLTLRQASSNEITDEIKNYTDATKEKGALLLTQLKDEQEKACMIMSDRQKSTVVDYEKEYCIALENSSYSMCLQEIGMLCCIVL
jgi:hypothetical protein